jgi:uncharacterized membrane protein YhfC
MSTDLEERNAKAILQTLSQQNAKFSEMEARIQAMAVQLSMLQQSYQTLREQTTKMLIEKLGHGPTSG